MKVSACLIARNEAATISRCIESFREFVNEIILVDTGSTDDTISIAKALGAKVFHYQWQDDFASARNFALRQAKGEWIVFLDADEYFVNNTAANILSIINQIHVNPKIDGIYCGMVHIDRNTGTFMGADPLVRIFRNSRQLRYEGSIHEMLVKKNGIPTFFTPEKNTLALYHTGYSLDGSEKAKRNLAFLQTQIDRGDDKDLTPLYMSDCYSALGEYEKALDYAVKFIDKNINVPGFNCRPYVTKINSMFFLREQYSLEDIYIAVKDALNKFPDFPEFHRMEARYLILSKRYSEALKKLLETLECNERYHGFDGNILPASLDDMYFTIASIYAKKNDDILALDYYVKALQNNRFNKTAFYSLVLLLKNQHAEDINLFLNSIYNIDSEQDVQFLVTQLAKLKIRGVLLYYQNIWKNKFGHDDISKLIVILAQGHFNNAFRHFKNCFLENGDSQWEFFSVVAALLAGDSLAAEELNGLVQGTYQRILLGYFFSENCKVEFIADDADFYTQVLEEILLLGDDAQVNRILALSNNFVIDITDRIGTLLLKFTQYQRFLEYYQNFVKPSQNSTVIYIVGFCHYKLGNYAVALNEFQKSIQFGYQGHDVLEIIDWITEKIDTRP